MFQVRQDYDDSFISTDRRFEAMVQPDELEGYQQDQEDEEEDSKFEESEIEASRNVPKSCFNSNLGH